MIKTLACACALVIGAGLTSATAAEREQVRMVINLVAATNFEVTFRPSMTKAFRLHSSTWVNSRA
jgi:hypothetical protein